MSNSPVRRPVSQVEDFKARFGVVQGQRRSEHRHAEHQGYVAAGSGFSSRQIIAAIALALLAGMSGAGVFWFAQDLGQRPPVASQQPAGTQATQAASVERPEVPAPQQSAALPASGGTDAPLLAGKSPPADGLTAPAATVSRRKIQDRLQPEPPQAPESTQVAATAAAPPAAAPPPAAPPVETSSVAAPPVAKPPAPEAPAPEPPAPLPQPAPEPVVAAPAAPAPEPAAAQAVAVAQPVPEPLQAPAPVVAPQPVVEAVNPAPATAAAPAPELQAAPEVAEDAAPEASAPQPVEEAAEPDEPVQTAQAVVVVPEPQVVPEPSIVAGQVWRDCDSCPELVAVVAPRPGTPGALQFAAQNEASGVLPFAIGRFEITFDDWNLCVVGGGCSAVPSDAGFGAGLRPVINVSYQMIAEEYLPWLSRISSKTYRLPTSQEWDIAEAGGVAGVNLGPVAPSFQGLCRTANFAETAQTVGAPCNDPFPQTAPVGSYAANGIGLHDMRGNVWEWVADCWTPGFNYKTKPSERDCRRHVVRGGSWSSQPALGAVAPRGFEDQTRTTRTIGFRIARSLP